MIIGLTGYKLSGKDTAGAYLMKQHGFERISTIDNMKRIIAELFDISFEEVDRLKNDSSCVISIISGGAFSDQTISKSQIMREFQQRFGSAVRHVLGDNTWLDASLPSDGYYNGRKIVVTNIRFPNEAQRVQDLGGYVVRIIRGDNTTIDNHETETSVDQIVPDYVITNNGTIEDLYDEIEHLLAVM